MYGGKILDTASMDTDSCLSCVTHGMGIMLIGVIIGMKIYFLTNAFLALLLTTVHSNPVFIVKYSCQNATETIFNGIKKWDTVKLWNTGVSFFVQQFDSMKFLADRCPFFWGRISWQSILLDMKYPLMLWCWWKKLRPYVAIPKVLHWEPYLIQSTSRKVSCLVKKQKSKYTVVVVVDWLGLVAAVVAVVCSRYFSELWSSILPHTSWDPYACIVFMYWSSVSNSTWYM